MNPVLNKINVYTYIICPYCKPVEFLLKVNGIDFVRHELNLMKGEHMTEEYMKINPLHKVPAIISNDLILFESNTINRYLCNSQNIEDRWYPKDPVKRAMIDCYFDWHASNASQLFKYTYVKMGWIKSITLEEAKRISDESFSDLENTFLNRFKYVAGENVTIADLALPWHLKGIHALGYEFSPRVKEYYDSVLSAEPGLEENVIEYIQDRVKILGN